MDRGTVLPSHVYASSLDMDIYRDTVCTQSIVLIDSPISQVTAIRGTELAEIEIKRAE